MTIQPEKLSILVKLNMGVSAADGYLAYGPVVRKLTLRDIESGAGSIVNDPFGKDNCEPAG